MKLTKAFIARLSNDGYVKIDLDEIDKVIQGIQTGSLIIIRNGIINPSYLIGIMEDKERMNEWNRMCNYTDESGERARIEGMKPLRNIFEGTEIGRRMLEGPKGTTTVFG